MASENITRHLCQCGCGKATSIARMTCNSVGRVAGQPNRFLVGHRVALKARYRSATGVRGSKTREHVIVAERALGKMLPSGAAVHHVNENGRDNRNCNLVICQDNAYHKLLHARMRVVKAGGNPDLQALCSACDLLHPTSDFYVRLTGPKAGSRVSHCKSCSRLKARETHAKTFHVPKGLRA